MNITVIVCTFNRCDRLGTALESLARSILPGSVDWEVLVVDNNSTDRTREVIQQFCGQYPGRFRYLSEPKPGKSNALNAGVRESQADVLAFTDDDVEVTPEWLQNLTASLLDDEWAGVAGRILPEQSFSPPRWIPHMDRYALGPLAVFNPDLEAGRIHESPVGANMAFRKRVFKAHGGFRTDLGPKPHSENPQKSEDSEFGHRLLMAGERLRYEPSAVVYHSVPASRIQKEYFLDWWYDKARADIRAHGAPTGSRLIIGGIPIGVFRRLAIWTVRWMVAVRPAHRFSLKLKVWINLGELKEYHRLSRQAAAGTPQTSAESSKQA